MRQDPKENSQNSEEDRDDEKDNDDNGENRDDKRFIVRPEEFKGEVLEEILSLVSCQNFGFV